jgi:hypothetical protein
LKAVDYNKLDDVVTIGECDVPVFSNTSELAVTRHTKRNFMLQANKYGQAVTRKARIEKFKHATGLDN